MEMHAHLLSASTANTHIALLRIFSFAQCINSKHSYCITAHLLSNATNSLSKAMEICSGQLSDEIFDRKSDFLLIKYSCIKFAVARFVTPFYISVSL